MLQIDLENANRLKKYSYRLTKYADDINNKKNNLIQTSNLNLDTRDITNEAIHTKITQLNFSIDSITNVIENMSSEAQVIAAKLSIMK
ncbi:hypothetical protein [Clostridium sp.]|uniref:hypothetical protein n=1 Tax=Clostridium sp. TaxID=1506 RepID=UPI0026095CFB|nr:hypothetical protein [uncultured Clostridium sp.]